MDNEYTLTTDEYVKAIIYQIETSNPHVNKEGLKELEEAITKVVFESLRQPCDICNTNMQIIIKRNDNDTGWCSRCLKCGNEYELILSFPDIDA